MAFVNKAQVILIVVASIFFILVAQSATFGVNLYENKHFKGRSTAIDVHEGCVDVPFEWEDITSSIQPQDCIIIYKHPKCQGPRIRLEPWSFGTAFLREINFEDKLSSISPCNFQDTQ